MLFREWHLDYRGALFTITANTSLLHNSTQKPLQRCSQNKEGSSASMWIFGEFSVWLFSGFRRKTVVHSNLRVHLFWLQWLIVIVNTVLAVYCYMHTKRVFLLDVVTWNIHNTTLSKCNPRKVPPPHHPLLSFLSPVLTQSSIFQILKGSHIAPVTHFKCIPD